MSDIPLFIRVQDHFEKFQTDKAKNLAAEKEERSIAQN
jgi:hypothetical protein